MPKYEISGSPSDGYRIWRIDADGNVLEQESPPFHDPRDALKWAWLHSIPAVIMDLSVPCDHDWVVHQPLAGNVDDLCVKCGASKASDWP